MRVEMLPNGFVRVDSSSGLVHLWECVDGQVQRRSGNGRDEIGEREQVASLYAVKS